MDPWPRADARVVGSIQVDVGDVGATSDAHLTLRLLDDEGRQRADCETRLAALPSAVRRTSNPRRLALHDPLRILRLDDRIRALGHEPAPVEDADLLVTAELRPWILRRAEESGQRVLVLVRTRDALGGAEDLARRASVVLRKFPVSGAPGQRSPWEGDWVTSFSWLLPGTFPNVPERNPLDFAFEEVLPDHVLAGYDPTRHGEEVPCGMFVGWVHSPAALVWSFRQGRGAVTLTTLHVAPENGPVATAMLEGLIQHASAVDRRGSKRPLAEGRA